MTNVRTNNGSEKLVNVAGMMVTPDKVEARLAALARGRRIHEEMLQAQRELRDEETRDLLEKGYTDVEINNMFRQRHLEDLEYRGFGVSKRVPRVKRPA